MLCEDKCHSSLTEKAGLVSRDAGHHRGNLITAENQDLFSGIRAGKGFSDVKFTPRQLSSISTPKIPLIPLPTQMHLFIINPCISIEYVSELLYLLEKTASSNILENDCWSVFVGQISFPLEVHFHIACSALLVFAIRVRSARLLTCPSHFYIPGFSTVFKYYL